MRAATYTRESLAAEVGVSEDTLKTWLRQGLISPARGRGNHRDRYYDDGHLRECRALLVLKEFTTRLVDLGPHLREERITIVDYLHERVAELRRYA